MNIKNIKERIKHEILPAVPVPFFKDRTIDIESQKKYIEWMNKQPVNAVAIWAHTGRGLFLTKEQRELVFNNWRKGLDEEKIILCGVGANKSDEITDEEYIREAVEMAKHAKELGAEIIMPYAPTLFRGRTDQDEMIIKYHESIKEVDLPMILFYLYEAAGGITYSNEVLRKLFTIDNVVGIKMATLDSVMTYQDVSNLIDKEYKDVSLITGEDRMFGYTVMRGATGALIGLSSVYTKLQKDMLTSYFDKDYEQFIEKSYLVDRLAEHTFYQPMEGYIERVLYILAEKGIIDQDSANDPYGPGINEKEKEIITRFIEELGDM